MRSISVLVLVFVAALLVAPAAHADCGSAGICALSFLDDHHGGHGSPVFDCLIDHGQPACDDNHLRAFADADVVTHVLAGGTTLGGGVRVGLGGRWIFAAIELQDGAITSGRIDVGADARGRGGEPTHVADSMFQQAFVLGASHELGGLRWSVDTALGMRGFVDVSPDPRDHRRDNAIDRTLEVRAAAELPIRAHVTARVFAGSSVLHGDDLVGGIGVGVHGFHHRVRRLSAR